MRSTALERNKMSNKREENFIGRFVRPQSYFQKIKELERRARAAEDKERLENPYVEFAADEKSGDERGSSSESESQENYASADDTVSEATQATQAFRGVRHYEDTQRPNTTRMTAAPIKYRGRANQTGMPMQLAAVTQPGGSITSDQPCSEDWINLGPQANSTRNRSLGTSAAGFNPISCSTVSINKWMKQENWPHQKFTDVDDQSKRRQNWVNWAHGFKIACGLVGDMTQEQRKMIFLRQGQSHIWDIIGAGVETLTFSQMWDKVDKFFASTSDPAVHAAAYRTMSSKCNLTRAL